MTRKERIDNLSKKMGIDLPIDGLFSAIAGHPVINIVRVDDMLSANDPEYINMACTYKGKQEVSMKDYITEKFGKEICKEFETLTKK